MKNMFKIFKKKVKDIVKPKPPISMVVNNKKYIIEDSVFVSVQSSAEDIQVYGWSLESRYKNNGEFGSWFTYYNNKIYRSRESAMDACIKSRSVSATSWEYRIIPLYRMSD